uniref:DUF6824 domain-containing protein n=1 Tax=Cyclophora tenuis TaxID=216820 RepID=A0A7S1GQ80_CYCTE|mmetsp:Transcript_6081/g.10604  ORF Transcript_6081/g.10604 Transcript_6081/m.10604 type:complete len:276 (+) Transcript_6081:232-1059(+)
MTTAMPETRVTSSAWMPDFKKEAKTPLTNADPSIFADAEEDDVRIPSGDAALRIQSDQQLSSAAFLLASAARMPSYTVSTDSKGVSAQVPSDWLQSKVLSSSVLASLPSQRSSSLEVLRYLGLMPDVSVPTTEALLRQMSATCSTPNPVQTRLNVAESPMAPVTRTEPRQPQEFAEDEIREWDVLCGRGGKSNHHSGNKRYRQVVSEMKNKYRGTSAKTDKTALSRAIVDYVNGYGGRFMKKNSKTGKWILLTSAEARKKTSQALRETKELKWTL